MVMVRVRVGVLPGLAGLVVRMDFPSAPIIEKVNEPPEFASERHTSLSRSLAWIRLPLETGSSWP